MRVGIAQVDSTAGALCDNAAKITRFIRLARSKKCELVVFPEMVLTGYPVSDLALETDFLVENRQWLERIAKETKGIGAIVGFIDFNSDKKGEDGSWLKFNAAAFLYNGKIVGVQHKTLLPTYGVFDEKRFFSPAGSRNVFSLNGKRFGIAICEDMWDDNYAIKPIEELVASGAELVVVISASPFRIGKLAERQALLQRHSAKNLPIVFCNKVGVQDNGIDILVFDGQSMLWAPGGKMVAIAERFREQLLVVDLNANKSVEAPACKPIAELLEALVFGLKGYAKKTGFSKAVLGLSGGIDSSVVACIASLAFGPKNVLGVAMPSKFNSPQSLADARALAKNLGIRFAEIPIQEMVDLNHKKYFEAFGRELHGIALENPQARLRANILMTISNAQKRLLLGTGNKTELALGYCTLYGDMAAGVEVIGDVSKESVYLLAAHINASMGKPIPDSVIGKVPSAELAPNQKDPFDYSKVSPLVDLIVEENMPRAKLVEAGYSPDLVDRIKGLIVSSQYKRKQAPPVIRVTKRAFGSGRAYPIINRWK